MANAYGDAVVVTIVFFGGYWVGANLNWFALRGSVVPGQSAADGLWNVSQTSTLQFFEFLCDRHFRFSMLVPG